MGWLPGLEPLPIRQKVILVQLRPGHGQPMLASWESAADQLDGVNAINTDSALVVGVKMRPMMWGTGFGIHANNNPKETRNL